MKEHVILKYFSVTENRKDARHVGLFFLSSSHSSWFTE